MSTAGLAIIPGSGWWQLFGRRNAVSPTNGSRAKWVRLGRASIPKFRLKILAKVGTRWIWVHRSWGIPHSLFPLKHQSKPSLRVNSHLELKFYRNQKKFLGPQPPKYYKLGFEQNNPPTITISTLHLWKRVEAARYLKNRGMRANMKTIWRFYQVSQGTQGYPENKKTTWVSSWSRHQHPN